MGIVHLAIKDLKLLVRDPMALFWVLGFPLLFALFIGAVVRAGLSGEAGPLRVVLVDEANSEATHEASRRLSGEQRLELTTATFGEAERAVRHADAVAYFRLPQGFGEAAGPKVRAELGFDPAREMEVAYVEQLLLEAMHASARRALSDTGAIDKRQVFASRAQASSASDIVFPSAVLWGLIGCAACFAVSLVAERTRGTYVRLRALPLTSQSLLAGKALASLIAGIVVAFSLTLIGVLFFEVRVSDGLKFSMALVATALCFVGITMALSVLGRTEQAVAGAGWATLLVMAMLGGGMVPLSLMPEWLTDISHISPVKWGILALEGGTWRAFSFLELLVPCTVLLTIGGVSFLMGVLVFSRAET